MLLQAPARFLLHALGWTLRYEDPGTCRYVLIVAPHTSNWDFPLGLLAAWAMDLRANWMGKHTLFKGILGPFSRALGGIPVYRDDASDMVQQMADRFAEADHLVLGMAPEGTRKHQAHWKSGFWHIARVARVPIAMAYIDYATREIAVGGTFNPSDDREADFEIIRDFYRGRRGKHPGKEGTIRGRPSGD
jgi:1-acyl-sn-glycerol-3-phosphate acyltransferase